VHELIGKDQRRRTQERLESLLLEGLNSGEPIPVDEKFWADLKSEALERIKARKKSKAKQE